jgi:hypothetical protein
LLLIPDSWLKHSFRKPLGFLAATIAALAVYLAVEHGCNQAQEAMGGANYTPLALAVLAYTVAALVVASSAQYSRLVRTLAVITLPLAVFFVPALTIGVLQDLGARSCAVQK